MKQGKQNKKETSEGNSPLLSLQKTPTSYQAPYFPPFLCFAHLNWSSVTPLPIAVVLLTPPITIIRMLSM